jgi:hypothetical protein
MGEIMAAFRQLLALVLLAAFLSPTPGVADVRPPVAKYAKAFRGPDGLVVSLLGIGKPEDEEYLLQYSGINHEWDMKIFKVKKEPSGRGHSYVMMVNDSEYHTLLERPGWGGGMGYEIYIPKTADGVAVSYDDDYAKRIKPQHYLTDYLEQEKGNVVKGAAWR